VREGWVSGLLAFSILQGTLSAGLGVPKIDPETGKIRMLMIGEVDIHHQDATYFLLSDPRVDLTLIPAGDIADPDTSKRFVRIYVPRTKEKLVSNFDVIELFDFVPYVLRNEHIQWIHDAVRDHGLGLALVEMGWYAVSDWTGNDAAAWSGTVLYQAYPADLVLGKQNLRTAYMDITTESLLTALPLFDRIPLTTVEQHGIQVARAGSVVYTVWRAGKEDAIIGGTYGAGTTLMIPMGWDNVPDATERGWEYYVDFVLNHAYYVANLPLPEDPDLARRLRNSFNEYLTRRSLAAALLDFVGKFGANTAGIEKLIGDLEGDRKRAERLYIEGDYEAAWQTMDNLLSEFAELSEESMKLRQRALLWVYLIEWLAVTATLLLCGAALWTLMVRRRLYREVKTTRASL